MFFICVVITSKRKMELNFRLNKGDFKVGDTYFLDFTTGKTIKYNETEENEFNNELDGFLKNIGVN